MGLPILLEKMQELRRKNPNAPAGVLWVTADWLCLDEFLGLLAFNKTALIAFKSLLQTQIAVANEAVAGLRLIIAQLQTSIAICSFFLKTLESTIAKATGTLNLFPFGLDGYIRCPPVQGIKELVTSIFPTPDPASLIPGNAGKLAKKYKQSLDSLTEVRYRLFRLSKQVADIEDAISRYEIQIQCWQAVIDAIGSQFGV